MLKSSQIEALETVTIATNAKLNDVIVKVEGHSSFYNFFNSIHTLVMANKISCAIFSCAIFGFCYLHHLGAYGAIYDLFANQKLMMQQIKANTNQNYRTNAQLTTVSEQNRSIIGSCRDMITSTNETQNRALELANANSRGIEYTNRQLQVQAVDIIAIHHDNSLLRDSTVNLENGVLNLHNRVENNHALIWKLGTIVRDNIVI